MRRREFIAVVGSAVVLPVAARAQQGGRRRRIGMLMGPAETDPDGQARAGAFRDAFAKLGWVDGQNAQLDYRWAAGDATRAKSYASDLASLPVDVIMTNGTAQLAAAQGATKSIAIVFAQVSDPVGGGFVSDAEGIGSVATSGSLSFRAANCPHRQEKYIRRSVGCLSIGTET